MKPFNIYMTGVGGQGIGLLSQALVRGADLSGMPVMAVDTHGLAQRGGVVVSRIRCGQGVNSPLTLAHDCDLVLGMEIHEALRGVSTALKKGGTLVYLNHSWQPLSVRMGQSNAVTQADISQACALFDARCIGLDIGQVIDPRMQNMALVGTVAKHGLIPGVDPDHYVQALEELLFGEILAQNLAVFRHYAQ